MGLPSSPPSPCVVWSPSSLARPQEPQLFPELPAARQLLHVEATEAPFRRGSIGDGSVAATCAHRPAAAADAAASHALDSAQFARTWTLGFARMSLLLWPIKKPRAPLPRGPV